MLTIEQQIEDTDIDEMMRLFPNAPYSPYTYQLAVYRVAAAEIRHYQHPFIIKAAVSAGKTTIISLLGTTIQKLKMPAMVLSRQAEIVEQDAAEMWAFAVKNSIFCSGLGMKSTSNRIIVASEKTAYNALQSELADFAPLVLMIDECQHVDVDDLITSEQRIVRKEITAMVDGEELPVETEYQGETYDDMIEAGRSQYTVLIRTLQDRCLKVHGKRLRIIGLTGTDYRGVQPIINEDLNTPGFWRKAVCDISTDFLVKFGAVVPTHFGDTGDIHYDLDEFRSDGADGEVDFSAEKLRKMQDSIHEQRKMTEAIMQDVYQRTLNRNAVLVTCAGKKHCEEAAAALPPGTTYCIITDSTSQKDRRKYLKDIFDGKIKFTFQIGCLTTGVNIPLWDTGVILRKIGSLTLLVQLIGRTMRKLKDFQVEAGYIKNEAMILDYSTTMAELGELYFNPILEQYTYQIAEQKQEFKYCPACQKMGKEGQNGEHARRCIHEHATRPVRLTTTPPKGYFLRPFSRKRYRYPVARCEYFWKSRVCQPMKDNTGRLINEGCGAENDITARFCRKCGGTLLDHNENLNRTHYTENDYYDVLRMNIKPTKNASLIFEYMLQDPKDGRSFRAVEFFAPGSDKAIARKLWREACKTHIPNPELARKIGGISNALAVMEHVSHFHSPVKSTHRKGKGGKDILYKKVFTHEAG